MTTDIRDCPPDGVEVEVRLWVQFDNFISPEDANELANGEGEAAGIQGGLERIRHCRRRHSPSPSQR